MSTHLGISLGILVVLSHPGFGQVLAPAEPLPVGLPIDSTADPQVSTDTQNSSSQPEHDGLVRRSVKRILEDEKELYVAPFHPRNFKWDLAVLAGTGALLATDKRIERRLPGGNLNIYGNASNIAIGSLSGTLAAAWFFGMKNHDGHLKEMGNLELETLVDTFFIYTPMQLIAGRQRPGVGNGNGDFSKHHNINTSFPAGHPMFTMAMAAVVAHEYPKTWVKVLAYGAVTTVVAGRLLAHDHWASDELVGTALGYFIGTHIFHAHCNPQFNESCRPPDQ